MMGLGWGMARRAVALVAVLATLGTGGGLGAQEAPAWDWEPTGLGESASELFTPASGAFFAKTASGLSRSDDGGVTWASVALPPGFPGRRWGGVGVAVDPSDHTTLYVGTSVSRDDAVTWVPMLPWPEQQSFSAIAVSLSDRGLIPGSRWVRSAWRSTRAITRPPRSGPRCRATTRRRGSRCCRGRAEPPRSTRSRGQGGGSSL